jgi:hypothetical protein
MLPAPANEYIPRPGMYASQFEGPRTTRSLFDMCGEPGAPGAGLEPATLRLTAGCSAKLSYPGMVQHANNVTSFLSSYALYA